MSALPLVATQQPKRTGPLMDLLGHLVEAWDAVSFFLALYLVDIITFGKPVSPPSGKSEGFFGAGHQPSDSHFGLHARSRSYDEPSSPRPSARPSKDANLTGSSPALMQYDVPRSSSPRSMRSFSSSSDEDDEKKHTHLPRHFHRSADQSRAEARLHLHPHPTSASQHASPHSMFPMQPRRSSFWSDKTRRESVRRRSSASSGHASYPSTNLDAESRRQASLTSSQDGRTSPTVGRTSRADNGLHHNQKEVLRLQVEKALRWQPFVKLLLVALPLTVLFVVGLYVWMPRPLPLPSWFINIANVPLGDWVRWARMNTPARGQGLQLLQTLLASASQTWREVVGRL